MHQSKTSHINQIQLYRPPCSKCGAPTSLARIEPTDETDYDLRTFECVSCGHADVVSVRFK